MIRYPFHLVEQSNRLFESKAADTNKGGATRPPRISRTGCLNRKRRTPRTLKQMGRIPNESNRLFESKAADTRGLQEF